MNLGRCFTCILVIFLSSMAFEDVWANSDTSQNPMETQFPEFLEGGFTDKFTVLNNETIQFRILNLLPEFDAEIIRMEGRYQGRRTVMAKLTGLQGAAKPIPCDVFEGCDWPVTLSLKIPGYWPPGLYALHFPVKNAKRKRYIVFVVGSDVVKSQVLYIFDILTSQAYNFYAGGSFYGRLADKDKFAPSPIWTVSFNRPTFLGRAGAGGVAQFIPAGSYEDDDSRQFVDQHFDVDYISNDMFSRETVTQQAFMARLKRYKLIVIAGFHEYLSQSMIDALVEFVRDGGSLYLSGREFGFGVIRIDQTNRRMKFVQLRQNIKTLPHMMDVFCHAMYPKIALDGPAVKTPMRIQDTSSDMLKGTRYKAGDVLFNITSLSPGVVLKETQQGHFVVDSNAEHCRSAEVIAVSDPFMTNHKTITRSALTAFRIGKGLVFSAPGNAFNSNSHPMNKDIDKASFKNFKLRILQRLLDN